MKFAWRDRLPDWAAVNCDDAEEIDGSDDTFMCCLAEDEELKEWEEAM